MTWFLALQKCPWHVSIFGGHNQAKCGMHRLWWGCILYETPNVEYCCNIFTRIQSVHFSSKIHRFLWIKENHRDSLKRIAKVVELLRDSQHNFIIILCSKELKLLSRLNLHNWANLFHCANNKVEYFVRCLTNRWAFISETECNFISLGVKTHKKHGS